MSESNEFFDLIYFVSLVAYRLAVLFLLGTIAFEVNV
jgi:hypothetical protein